MTYTNSSKQATTKYLKDKQKRVPLNWKKSDYEEIIEPAIKRTGKPVSTFIKEAVEEKLKREGYL